jgi:DNA-binding NtrC family response regulator
MSKPQKILLVDDEERLLHSISQRISLLGHIPLTASSGQEAIDMARQTHIDLAIVDFKMPDMDGLVTITKLKELLPDLRTVLLTGYGNEKTKQATEALGTIYIEKDSMGGIWDIVKQSSSQGKVVVIKPSISGTKGQSSSHTPDQIEIFDHHHYLQNRTDQPTRPKIIGESHEVQRLKKNIKRFAEMDYPIIIKGENGTGKELVARTIHSLSRRSNQRFLAFDCGCFSTDFHFSELVNMIDDSSRLRLNKEAAGSSAAVRFRGTIFLDHIENMPKPTQQEMMALLDGTLFSAENEMDIRFIVVANQRLEDKISSGEFIKTLYGRIHAIELSVPPLRNRTEDLPILTRYFLDQLNKEFGKNIRSVSNEAVQALKAYTFPGNIRELKHIIERAVILSDNDVITLTDLPERLQPENRQMDQGSASTFLTIHEMEEQHILKALEITKGNKSKAAELLGISRAALWRKLRLIADDS